MILSVDPGLRACGLALWSGRTLTYAWLARSSADTQVNLADRWRAMVRAVGAGRLELLVMEMPRVYRASPGNPSDLLNLTAVLGGLTQTFDCSSVLYLPQRWTRGRNKEERRPVIDKELSDTERSRIEACPKSLLHNVYDAIGIGLFHFGRF